jgi:hypothetical protein
MEAPMLLDSRVKLLSDAEQAKRVIFEGKKMARRRFNLDRFSGGANTLRFGLLAGGSNYQS